MSKTANGKKIRPSSASILKTRTQPLALDKQTVQNLKLDGILQRRPTVKEDEGTKSVRFAQSHQQSDRLNIGDDCSDGKENPSVTYAFQNEQKEEIEALATGQPEAAPRKPRPMSAAVGK